MPPLGRVARVALLLAVAAVARAQETPAISSPEGEQEWQVNLDIRNRWVQDVGGSSDVYRSVVNLGEGPRLFGSDIRFRDSAGAWGVNRPTFPPTNTQKTIREQARHFHPTSAFRVRNARNGRGPAGADTLIIRELLL